MENKLAATEIKRSMFVNVSDVDDNKPSFAVCKVGLPANYSLGIGLLYRHISIKPREIFNIMIDVINRGILNYGEHQLEWLYGMHLENCYIIMKPWKLFNIGF